MKKFLSMMAACGLALAMTACQTNYAGSAYDPEFVRAGFDVAYGTLLGMGAATIEPGEGSGVVGGVAGGVLGGAVGNTIGGGSGRTLATAVGAVGGAAVGAMAERKMSRQNAVEFEVKLDSGKIISVVQTLGTDTFQPGQRVRVLTARGGEYAGQSRIRPMLGGE
jgi:outer membrane lipoprotein SlyB